MSAASYKADYEQELLLDLPCGFFFKEKEKNKNF